jgi:hypothetical protein
MFSLLITGCSQVEQAATDAANDVVSGAKDAASQAASDAVSGITSVAVDEVLQQVCKPVADGTISAGEKQLLSGLVTVAEEAGVPAEITTPMRDIAQAGDRVPAESVNALQDACANATS